MVVVSMSQAFETAAPYNLSTNRSEAIISVHLHLSLCKDEFHIKYAI